MGVDIFSGRRAFILHYHVFGAGDVCSGSLVAVSFGMGKKLTGSGYRVAPVLAPDSFGSVYRNFGRCHINVDGYVGGNDAAVGGSNVEDLW